MKTIVVIFFFFFPCALCAAITSGVTESFEAALDTPGDTTWSANIGGSRDWTFASNQTPIAVSNSGTPGITQAYDFNIAVATGTDYQGAFDTNADVTFEIWFKPDSMNERQILFEAGGSTDGFTISMAAGWVTVTSRDDDDYVEVYFRAADITDRHHQIVAVVDLDGSGGGTLSVYLDGVFVNSSTNANWGDWAGTNNPGLGRTVSSNAPGITLDDYTGEISIFRLYDSKALNAAEVLANYETVATATAAVVLESESFGANAETIWDADNPGDDSSNEWQVSHKINILALNDPWLFAGATKPTLSAISSSNYQINNSYYFDGVGYGSLEENLTVTANNMVFEIWIKPDDLSGQEILMEFGGSGDGTALALDDADFVYRANNTSSNVLQPTYDLSSVGIDDFIHCAAFVDIDNDAAYIFVNGVQVGSDNIATEFSDYDGANTNGLGLFAGTVGLTGYGNYEGHIAKIQLTTRGPEETSIDLSTASNLILNHYISEHKGKGIIFSVE